MFSIRKPIGLSLFGAVIAFGMLVLAPIASALVRPSGATPIGASLVIAYDECTVAGGSPPGQEHNTANLPGDACAPETPTSTLLTAGEPPAAGAANFKGNVKIVVCTTAAACSAGGSTFSTDVLFPGGAPAGNYLVDVRCTAGGAGFTTPASQCGTANAVGNPDYGSGAGAALLKATSIIRITDINTGPTGGPYTTEGTTEDLPFDVPVVCVPTASTAIGGSCVPAVAAANAACGGCVAAGKRSNIETGQIRVQDGGPDGNPFLVPADNKDYARQGVFIP
jgi:hypothetical protein